MLVGCTIEVASRCHGQRTRLRLGAVRYHATRAVSRLERTREASATDVKPRLTVNKHFSSTLSMHIHSKQPNPRKQPGNLDLTTTHSTAASRGLPRPRFYTPRALHRPGIRFTEMRSGRGSEGKGFTMAAGPSKWGGDLDAQGRSIAGARGPCPPVRRLCSAYLCHPSQHEPTRRHAAQAQPCQLSARLNKSRHRPRSVLGLRAQPQRRWRSVQSAGKPCYGANRPFCPRQVHRTTAKMALAPVWAFPPCMHAGRTQRWLMEQSQKIGGPGLISFACATCC
jgi:hypothetical protein